MILYDNILLLYSQSVYVMVYATFVTSALCYLLITWANSQVSSILVTAFWPVQVPCTLNKPPLTNK